MVLVLIAATLVVALAGAAFAVAAWIAARRNGSGAPEGFARLEQAIERLAPLLREEARAIRTELRDALAAQAQVEEARFGGFRLSLERQQETLRTQQKEALDQVGAKVQALMESNEKRQEALRESLNLNLAELRKDNEAKLEQMRQTVDEKLQGTLEKRLGESFQIVSDRLDLVHKGLGEMQTLATGVGDLKRVLTNVKSRGGWAEVQLGRLLEDMLAPDQFVRNARIRPETQEVVEYAVRLPGQGDDGACLLPIDAKFPNEDFERLLHAQERGAPPEELEALGAALERAIRAEAGRICEKYIHAPATTDFAIMYLPTEGLFAEAIRRPGLVAELQGRWRVTIAGPTTLQAFLTSLQMGFRTLAIQKRSSEVWQVLGAAKSEFRKYGDVWDKLAKQLETAKRTVDDAGRRTRAVERRLREVEEVPLAVEGAALSTLPLASIDPEEPDADDEAA